MKSNDTKSNFNTHIHNGQLRNWEDVNQSVQDYSDSAWAMLFRHLIPASKYLTRNLMKLYVDSSVHLTRRNLVSLCELIPKLHSLVSFRCRASIEDEKDDDDGYTIGMSLCHMIRNAPNIATLALSALRLSEAFEFSKGIRHTSSLKNLSFAILLDKSHDIKLILFNTMHNISKARGLCDIRIYLSSAQFHIEDPIYTKRIENLDFLDLRRYPKRSFGHIGMKEESVNTGNLLTLLAGCGGSKVSMDILITFLLIRQRGHNPLISRLIPAVLLRIAMFGSHRSLRTVSLCTILVSQCSVGCPCGSATLSKRLVYNRGRGFPLANEWLNNNTWIDGIMARWRCPYCDSSADEI